MERAHHQDVEPQVLNHNLQLLLQTAADQGAARTCQLRVEVAVVRETIHMFPARQLLGQLVGKTLRTTQRCLV